MTKISWKAQPHREFLWENGTRALHWLRRPSAFWDRRESARTPRKRGSGGRGGPPGRSCAAGWSGPRRCVRWRWKCKGGSVPHPRRHSHEPGAPLSSKTPVTRGRSVGWTLRQYKWTSAMCAVEVKKEWTWRWLKTTVVKLNKKSVYMQKLWIIILDKVNLQK